MLLSVNKVAQRYGDMIADGIIDGSVRPCDPRIAAMMVASIASYSVELANWIPGFSPDMAVGFSLRPIFLGLFA